MGTPDVSVVVVHHRGLDHLIEALAGIDAASGRSPSKRSSWTTPGEARLGEVFRRHPTVRRVAGGRQRRLCPRDAASARRPRRLPRSSSSTTMRSSNPTPSTCSCSSLGSRRGGRRGRRRPALGPAPEQKNDFSDGFLTFDGHAFAQDVGRPLSSLPRSRPGEERLFACGGLMAVRRDVFLSSGGIRRRLLRLPGGRGLRLAAVDPRTADPRRAAGTGAASRRSDRRGARRFRARVPLREERVRDRLQELRPGALPRPDARGLRRLPGTSRANAREPQPGSREPAPGSVRGPARGGAFLAASPRDLASAADRAIVDDPLTIAQARALLWIHRNQDSLAAKRRAVQAARRRPTRRSSRSSPSASCRPTRATRASTPTSSASCSLRRRTSFRTTLAEIFQGRGVSLAFSVVIPTFERPDTLGRSSTPWRRRRRRPTSRSSWWTTARATKRPPGCRRYRAAYPLRVFAQGNSGPAAARNRGVREARGARILFLGDDTVPEAGLLAVHARAHAEPRRTAPIAVLGYTTWPRDRRVSPFLHHINEYGLQFGYGLIEDPESVPFNFFYTSNISLRARPAARGGPLRHDLPARRLGGHRDGLPPRPEGDEDRLSPGGGRPTPPRDLLRILPAPSGEVGRVGGDLLRQASGAGRFSRGSARRDGSRGAGPADGSPPAILGGAGQSAGSCPGRVPRSIACSARTT